MRRIKTINLAKTIAAKRREKGMTQEDLANYIGVSKASVSKWETGQSYPDITFLPQLATLFNISIDELMGYEPQLGKADIRKLYQELAKDFAEKPFDEVLSKCQEIIKNYYSCFPLLNQMGALLLNNSSQAKDQEQTLAVIKEAQRLFHKVKTESDEILLIKRALNLEAYCALALGDAKEVINLLESEDREISSSATILASAYQMQGKNKEAKEALQVETYQFIIALFDVLPQYLSLCFDDQNAFEETYKRAINLVTSFKIKKLHPMILVNLYLVAASGYLNFNNKEKALAILEECVLLVTSDIYPLKLKGDEYFDLLDNWIENLELGEQLPRDERIVRQSMVDVIAKNPTFTPLQEEYRYKCLLEKLETVKGDH